MTTVYITKYALTKGILCGEIDEARRTTDDNYVYLKHDQWTLLRLGKDAHLTIEEARTAAEKMRQKHVASLQRKLAKSEAICFLNAEAKPVR
jgi:hypothetical protein